MGLARGIGRIRLCSDIGREFGAVLSYVIIVLVSASRIKVLFRFIIGPDFFLSDFLDGDEDFTVGYRKPIVTDF